jgi:hypothetical protein
VQPYPETDPVYRAITRWARSPLATAGHDTISGDPPPSPRGESGAGGVR